MTKLINGSLVTITELIGLVGEKNAKKMTDGLLVFPTPFKGVYYTPFETERKAFYITYPYKVFFEAAKKYLKDEEIYYGMETALYFERRVWTPTGIHVMNKKLSRKLIFKENKKEYWRAKKKNEILGQYPYPVNFHKIKNIDYEGIKYKDGIRYSAYKKTLEDAKKLCKKGSKEACEFIKNLEKIRK